MILDDLVVITKFVPASKKHSKERQKFCLQNVTTHEGKNKNKRDVTLNRYVILPYPLMTSHLSAENKS